MQKTGKKNQMTIMILRMAIVLIYQNNNEDFLSEHSRQVKEK